jgi:hypothetical protein
LSTDRYSSGKPGRERRLIVQASSKEFSYVSAWIKDLFHKGLLAGGWKGDGSRKGNFTLVKRSSGMKMDAYSGRGEILSGIDHCNLMFVSQSFNGNKQEIRAGMWLETGGTFDRYLVTRTCCRNHPRKKGGRLTRFIYGLRCPYYWYYGVSWIFQLSEQDISGP